MRMYNVRQASQYILSEKLDQVSAVNNGKRQNCSDYFVSVSVTSAGSVSSGASQSPIDQLRGQPNEI